jgi:hypothetical protein
MVSDIEPMFLQQCDLARAFAAVRAQHIAASAVQGPQSPRQSAAQSSRCRVLLIDEMDACEAMAEGDPGRA